METENGSVTITKQLIAARCSINVQEVDGCTPLHIAAQNGHATVTKQLLAARCNVDLEAKNGCTPLYVAAANGHTSVTKQLIQAGCNMDFQEKNGFTPLHAAVQPGHEAVTEQLIVARCNVDLQATHGLSTLHMTASDGHAPITKQLLDARCNVHLQAFGLLGLTALQVAESMGHAGVAALIRQQETPLFGRCVVINGLVAKPELNGRTGMAVTFDDAKGRYSVELDGTSSSFKIKPCNLLPTPASPEQTKKQQEKADRAMENNHEKNCQGEEEPKERDDSEAGRELPVPQERKSGSGKAMTGQQLLDCNVDIQDKNGGTLQLHDAALSGNATMTKQVLAARCRVDLQDKNGYTPLHYAAGQGHEAVTKQLIEARCNVDLQTEENGCTPLHIAATNGHETVTKQLLVRVVTSTTRLRMTLLSSLAWRSTLQRPEETKKQQEDTDGAMKALLEEEDKDAAASAVSQKKKQAKKAGKERSLQRRDAVDGQDGNQKEEHAEEQKDTERTEAKASSEKNKTDSVAEVAVSAALKDKTEERGGKEEEEGKQGAAESKKAEGAGTSQEIQGSGLSQEKDDDDVLPDESSAKRKSKSKKKREGDQGTSASETAPWATEAKEAGPVAAGVGVEAKSWPPPLQADVEQGAAAAISEGEKLFMSKFNLWPSDTSSGEAPTAAFTTALGPATVPGETLAPAESMSRAAPADVHPRTPNYMDSFHCPLTMEVMRDPHMSRPTSRYATSSKKVAC